MPYVLGRDVSSLGLKAGDKLNHEQGKLPSALKFDAFWHEEPKPKAEPKKKPAVKK